MRGQGEEGGDEEGRKRETGPEAPSAAWVAPSSLLHGTVSFPGERGAGGQGLGHRVKRVPHPSQPAVSRATGCPSVPCRQHRGHTERPAHKAPARGWPGPASTQTLALPTPARTCG